MRRPEPVEGYCLERFSTRIAMSVMLAPLVDMVLAQSFEERNERFSRQFGIAQNLAQESPSNILARMNRHGHNPPIWMFHPHVTTSLSDDLKACPFQSAYELVGSQYRQLGHQTTTF